VEANMTIDVESERLIRLSDGPRKLPGGPSSQALTDWATKGKRGKSGRYHKLEVVMIGKSPHTSIEAFQRFCDRLTADSAYAGEKTPAKKTGGK
jgi:hypothetical protein